MCCVHQHGIPEYNALTDKHCAGHNFLDLAPVKQLVKSGLVSAAGVPVPPLSHAYCTPQLLGVDTLARLSPVLVLVRVCWCCSLRQVKKRSDGKLQVVERPSRYLFFGEQPDGPASTRVRTQRACQSAPASGCAPASGSRARLTSRYAPPPLQPATGKRSELYRKFKQERSPKLQQVEAERVAAIRRCRLEPLNTTHGVNSALRVVLSSPDLNAQREVRGGGTTGSRCRPACPRPSVALRCVAHERGSHLTL